MNIEPLEPRIAPASAFVTYTDFDGDLVKITASKPGSVAPPLDGSHLTLASFVGPLVILDLTDPAFGGAKIVFTVTKKPGGDGLANVGRINATGVDLDQVVVKGTLGEIVAGDATTAGDPGLNLLSVLGMGEVGPSTATHLFNSTITGKLGALKVAGDFTDAFLRVVGGADGQLGAVTITGDVTGLGGTSAGRVDSEGAMGVVKIGGDLRGGAPFGTGLISSGTSIGAITIGGGVFGGAGESSGRLESAGTMGNVKITGSLTGGTGSNSGAIVATGLGSVTIGGSVFGAKTDPGGSHNRTGVIESLGTMGAVKIGGDVDAGVLATSGYIHSVGRLPALTVTGSLLGGAGFGSGWISADEGVTGVLKIGRDVKGGTGPNSGKIIDGSQAVTSTKVGALFIGGSLIGDAALKGSISVGTQQLARTTLTIKGDVDGGTVFISTNALAPATIAIKGNMAGGGIVGTDAAKVSIGGSMTAGFLSFSGAVASITIGKDLGSVTGGARIFAVGHAAIAGQPSIAIKSLTIGGNVLNSTIYAGASAVASNPDAEIGTVRVKGDWTASNLVAGVLSGTDNFFGDANDTVIIQAGEPDAFFSRIGSIVIGGIVSGSASSSDNFGFVAQQIGSFKSKGFTAALTPDNDTIIPVPSATNDVAIREV